MEDTLPESYLILPGDLIIRPEDKNPESERAIDYILKPWQIPIAPAVYHSRDTYTKEYVEEVIQRLLEAIKRDIAAIKSITKKHFDAVVNGEKVEYGEFDRAIQGHFSYTVDTERRKIDFMEGGTSITL